MAGSLGPARSSTALSKRPSALEYKPHRSETASCRRVVVSSSGFVAAGMRNQCGRASVASCERVQPTSPPNLELSAHANSI